MCSQMVMNCDRFRRRFVRKVAESGGHPPVRPLDASKRLLNRPFQGVTLFALDLRRVVSCDAQASRLPNALPENKNSHVTVNTIYDYMA